MKTARGKEWNRKTFKFDGIEPRKKGGKKKKEKEKEKKLDWEEADNNISSNEKVEKETKKVKERGENRKQLTTRKGKEKSSPSMRKCIE